MSTINISDLRPTGTELFSDSEGYMNELSDSEFDGIYGGLTGWLLFSAVIAASKVSSAQCAKVSAAAVSVVSAAVSGWITGGND